MNNTYYNNPKQPIPGNPLYVNTPTQNNMNTTNFPVEQSYVENILRLNRGKKVRIHQTFPDSTEWRDLEFNGIIEASGRDHIIVSDPSNGSWHVLLMIYVDYISFDEPINYSSDFYPNN